MWPHEFRDVACCYAVSFMPEAIAHFGFADAEEIGKVKFEQHEGFCRAWCDISGVQAFVDFPENPHVMKCGHDVSIRWFDNRVKRHFSYWSTARNEPY